VVQEFIFSYCGSIFHTYKCAIKYCLVIAGWDVENGPLDQDNSLKPAMLISLSAPKLYSIISGSKIIKVDYGRCARFFHGIHYLGGRFIAPALATKYKLKLPNYPSTHNCVRL
jgi:NAD(P)H-hydrate epimerase